MTKIIDLTGKRFGRLVVVSRAENDKRGQSRWRCLCDCGTEKTVTGSHLKNGNTKSCGCLHKEIAANTKLSHGGKHTPLYVTWCNMKQRCNNKNASYYYCYGGRGIKVCDEWENSFETFRDWALANGYEDGLTIDRLNNDGNYEPSNCKWSTQKEQSRHRRNNINLTIGGITKTLVEWSEIFHLPYGTLYERYCKGWRGIKLVQGGKI